MARKSELGAWLGTISLGMLFWIGLAGLPGSARYVPEPWDVLRVLLPEREVLLQQSLATLRAAIAGFFLGTVAAIGAAFLVVWYPRLRQSFVLTGVAVYSVPLIAAAPLVALSLGPAHAGAALGCIGAYLPMFLTGLRAGDRASKSFAEIVLVHGASRCSELRLVRLPLMVRGWMVAAQAGWTWAVLGALIGDFTGGRWGLGTFLTGTLTRGEPARVWSVAALCLVISGVGTAAIRFANLFFPSQATEDPLDATAPEPKEAIGERCRSLMVDLTSAMGLLAAWQCGAWIASPGGGVLSGPLEIASAAHDVFVGTAALSVMDLTSALCSTVLAACVGLALSLALAFALAASKHFFTILSRPFVLGVLITQVTPIVAFVPIIALLFGRDLASVVIIVILSTIYPSYTVYERAFEDVPRVALDTIRLFGGGASSEFWYVRLPHAAWMSLVAIRLAVARALLGAITAEYLLTGRGVGGLLGQARALLDFRMVWLVCTLVAATTLVLDATARTLEGALANFSKKVS